MSQNTYVDKLSKIDKHDLTTILSAASSVEAYGNHFIHTSSLEPILLHDELEDLDAGIYSVWRNFLELMCKADHHILGYKPKLAAQPSIYFV